MKTHKFDSLSFLAGVVIAGIGLAFLLLPDIDALVDFVTDAANWFWPVVFIAIGVAIIAPLTSRISKGTADPSESEQSERHDADAQV